MNLSRLAVKRPITIIMITLAVMLLGYVSLTKLPIDLLPNIEIPIAAVSVSYQGVGPQEIEKLITIPLEGAVGTVSNLKEVRSISREGNSLIIAEFNFGADMDMVALEIREKVDLVKPFLPEDVGDPVVLKLDPDSIPVVQISLAGIDNASELQEFADDIVKPHLERLEGVAAVDISGGVTKQIELRVDQNLLHGYGLNIDTLTGMIAAENINLPGGIVKKGEYEYTIRTVGEFSSIEELRNMNLVLRSGGTIRLEDIADVALVGDTNSLVRVNGDRSIDISVRKQSGTNTVKVAKEIITSLEKLQTKYSQYQLMPIINQADYIQLAIDKLTENALIGCLLAIVVLYLFFRNVKTTLIIAIAIPVSIIGAFVLLYFNGITLNLMTLGGLALAVGMLVDNAIVVLENIFRLRQEGATKDEAAVKGASEVAMAVTASTLTTVAVFLPIVFVEGITSEIFRELALTVTLSLFASLAVSLTLIPMLASKYITVNQSNVTKKSTKVFEKAINAYRKLLQKALYYPLRTAGLGILIFVICISPLFFIGAEFFPEMDQGQFTISIDLPSGATLERAEELNFKVEELLLDIPEITIVYSSVQDGSANMTVLTEKSDSTQRGTAAVADEVRQLVRDIPGVDISVSVASATMMMGGGIGGAPISVSIKGEDLASLQKISSDFVDLISQVEGTRMVTSSFTEGVPEVLVTMNRSQASQFGLTTAQVAQTIRTLMSGSVVTRYKLDNREIDVLIKGKNYNSNSIGDLEHLMISTPTGALIPLSQIADIKIAQGPQTINREGQMRVATVSAQIFNRDLQSVSTDIENMIGAYNMPRGYNYEIGGEYSEMNEALQDLSLALVLAIILVYMVLASQFESLLSPFIIIFAVPLSFSGGALGLFLTNNTLSVPVMIGAIILAGVVVNDAIVLIDYINARRKRGEDVVSAILNAGPVRLRPILITTLTTVLGLVPMAIGIGEGAEALAPMAITVIFGLSMATLLTLVFIPVVYLLLDRVRIRVQNIK